MKKLLNGIFTISMVFVFAVALTGCGKENTPANGETNNQGKNGEYQGDAKGAADLKNVSNSNYKEVAKNVVGIELKDASGWTVNNAQSLNGVNNLEIKYDVTAGEDAKTVIEYYYNQCKSVSTDGIYEVKTNYENYTTSKGTKYDTFEEYFATATRIGSLYQAKWIFDNNGKNIQYTISINETSATISFTLLG